jgi:hypothetical protein
VYVNFEYSGVVEWSMIQRNAPVGRWLLLPNANGRRNSEDKSFKNCALLSPDERVSFVRHRSACDFARGVGSERVASLLLGISSSKIIFFESIVS